jgi:hypothetical protein
MNSVQDILEMVATEAKETTPIVAPNSDGSPSAEWMPWPTGDLVDVRENSMSVVAHEFGKPLPSDCCAMQRKLKLIRTESKGTT